MSDDRTPPNPDEEPDEATATEPFEAAVRAALAASARTHTPDPELEAQVAARARRRPAWPQRAALAAAAVVVVVLVLSIAVRPDGDVDLSTSPGTDPPPTSTTPTTSTTDPSVVGTTEVPAPDPGVPPGEPTTVPPDQRAPADVLAVRGIAGIDFGGATADAERAVTALIGPPVGRFIEPACAERTIITWGSFALWDQDGSVTEWSLIGDAGLGLRTDRGIGIGATADEVRAAYPEADSGSFSVEESVRSGFAIADPTGNVAWAAVLGDGDRVIALHSSPGALFPSTCAGRGATYLTLVPHLGGLGPLLFGTPPARVDAVLGAIYGETSRSVDEVQTIGECGPLTTTSYGPDRRVQVLVVPGGLAAYLVRGQGNIPAAILDQDGIYLRTGLSIGDWRSLTGREVRVSPDPNSEGEYVVTVTGDASEDRIEVIARSGRPGDDAILERLGVIRYPSC